MGSLLPPTPDSKATSITDSHLFLPSRTKPITIRLTPIPHIVSSLSQTTPILPNIWTHKATMQTKNEHTAINDIYTHDINTQPDTQQYFRDPYLAYRVTQSNP